MSWRRQLRSYGIRSLRYVGIVLALIATYFALTQIIVPRLTPGGGLGGVFDVAPTAPATAPATPGKAKP
jgi:hypothetical protein